LRHEAAKLVGFDNYADYSLATKMAASTGEVLEFLNELASRSRAAAKSELADLVEFAGMELEPWDITFWLEKFKQAKYSISNEELRQYFPAQTVINGLFNIAERLYGVRLAEQEDVALWHKDASFFTVLSADGEMIGGFYVDLYARSGKRNGAWIDECVSRQELAGESMLPVGYLVCNFPPPDETGQSLLTHDDVVTLFHEFGHMLHHLLTRIDLPSISGINGVPWDAVELPSQFMENFAWSYEVLKKCSAHSETQQSLPRELFNKLEESRNAGAGLAMLRQLELGMFDFRLHAEYSPLTTTAYPMRFRIFLQVAMQQVTTATSGQKCLRRMRFPLSRKPVFSIRRPRRGFARKFWRLAVVAILWKRILPLEAASRRLTHY
jgi:oligopeptidase A